MRPFLISVFSAVVITFSAQGATSSSELSFEEALLNHRFFYCTGGSFARLYAFFVDEDGETYLIGEDGVEFTKRERSGFLVIIEDEIHRISETNYHVS